MKKILLIEDDVSLALSIRENLKGQGYDTSIVENGQKGYRYASSQYFDVLLIDFGLPLLNGDEITKKLRFNQIEIPILMLTGRTSPQDLSTSFKIGVDDYITKPFSMIELSARIERLITRPPVMCSDKFQIEDLVIDFSLNSLKKNNWEITLTKREMKLLKFLLLNKNCTISRDRLISNVWIDKPYVNHNTVDCYVSNLRKKFGRLETQSIIQTAHGYGYKLNI